MSNPIVSSALHGVDPRPRRSTGPFATGSHRTHERAPSLGRGQMAWAIGQGEEVGRPYVDKDRQAVAALGAAWCAWRRRGRRRPLRPWQLWSLITGGRALTANTKPLSRSARTPRGWPPRHALRPGRRDAEDGHGGRSARATARVQRPDHRHRRCRMVTTQSSRFVVRRDQREIGLAVQVLQSHPGAHANCLVQNFLDFDPDLEGHWATFDLRSITWPDAAVLGVRGGAGRTLTGSDGPRSEADRDRSPYEWTSRHSSPIIVGAVPLLFCRQVRPQYCPAGRGSRCSHPAQRAGSQCRTATRRRDRERTPGAYASRSARSRS